MAAQTVDVIVVGGGAAGIFAAVNLAAMAPGCTVLVLEKSPKLLSKVKISGGGRCNVTHACFDNRELVKYYPRGGKQLRGAFSRFTTIDTIQWFDNRGVVLKTENDGRMFPVTDSSQTIIDCLLHEAAYVKVDIQTNAGLTAVTKTTKGFQVTVNQNRTIHCRYLVVACGGHHKLDFYHWLQQLGHTIVQPVPSLFTFNLPKNDITHLMGVSVPHALVKIAGTKLEQEGPLLITHWGLSGPAVLKLSAWGARELFDMDYRYEVVVNWLPGENENTLRTTIAGLRKQFGGALVMAKQPFGLPRRLWEYLCTKSQVATNTRWADLPAKQANLLAVHLTNDRYPANGKTTFKEEFVTAGGVDLKEVDFTTMQSKACPNLFFAGEILDIDGVTGGFNFQAAWTTAYIAATTVASQLSQ